jgi:hypothetical protein
MYEWKSSWHNVGVGLAKFPVSMSHHKPFSDILTKAFKSVAGSLVMVVPILEKVFCVTWGTCLV